MIHPAARLGFARSADAYERSRPAYPDPAIEHLVSRLLPAPGCSILPQGPAS